MIDVPYFTNLYLAEKRNLLKNPYLSLSHKAKDTLPEVVDTINLLHADPIDFLKFMVRYFAPARLFPQPSQMLSEKALNKYKYHQALKNIYVYDEYSVNGDNFLIHETMETVSYKKDIMCPVSKDPRLKYIMFLLLEGKLNSMENDKLIYKYTDLVYSIIKLKFLEKPIPQELLLAKERINATPSV